MSYTRTLITVKDAAKMLALAESTVRGRKAGTAKLAHVKLGRATRMILQEVEALRDKLAKSGQRQAGTL